MSTLMPAAIIGFVLAVYLGYYGLVVAVEGRTGRKPQSSQITEISSQAR